MNEWEIKGHLIIIPHFWFSWDTVDLKFSKVEEANEADKQMMNSYDVSVKFSNFRNIFMRNIEASAHKNKDRGTWK
jgi:hypothetical protein